MASLQTLIPIQKLAAVEKALLQTFGTKEVTEIIPLSGGLSAAMVYKITVDKGCYVLRLIMQADAINGPANHFTCLQIAADAAIAPLIYYISVEDGLSITGYIEHIPLKAVFQEADAVLLNLAERIKAIHATTLFPIVMDLRAVVDQLIMQFKAADIIPSNVSEECFNHYAVIRKHYPWDDKDKVSSHNDLNYGNILFDGKKIWIIDWEAASGNDRYVDLAIAAQSFVTNEREELLFLKSYFGYESDNYQCARFFLMQQVCYLVHSMTFFMLPARTKATNTVFNMDMQTPDLKEILKQISTGNILLSGRDGQLLYAKALFNEALHNMRSPYFLTAINQIIMEL